MKTDLQLIQAAIGDYSFQAATKNEKLSIDPFSFYEVGLPVSFRGLPRNWNFLILPEKDSLHETASIIEIATKVIRDSIREHKSPILVISNNPIVSFREEYMFPEQRVFFLDKVDLPSKPLPVSINDVPLILAIVNKFTKADVLKDLSPYLPKQPASDWRFFGRKKEVKDIIENRSNFFIIGSRQIGKTSLLQEVMRKLREIDEEVYWLPVQNAITIQDVVDAIASCLSPKEAYRATQIEKHISQDYLTTIIRRIKGPHKSITLIFDELGNVLSKLQRDNWSFMGTLRELSHNEGVRIIISAFQEVFIKQRQEFEGPFVNFGTTMRLHAFNKNEIEELIINPMSLWGKVDDKKSLYDLIRRKIGNHPLILQYLGDYLFGQLFIKNDVNIETIIEKMLASSDLNHFEAAVRDMFDDNNSYLERYIYIKMCLTLVKDTTDISSAVIKQSDLQLILEGLGISYTLDQKNDLLDRLYMRGLLDRSHENHFHFHIDAPIVFYYLSHFCDLNELCDNYLKEIKLEA